MKKAFLFLALCLLGAGRAAAAEPADSVRNVIYMIGDGMGLAHVSMLAVEGGYAPTAFDRAQGIALISTYSANNRVTDSAAAGTALACGSKTNNGTLGLDPRGGRLQSLIEWAVAEGMPAGIAVNAISSMPPLLRFTRMFRIGATKRPLRATCWRAISTCS